MCDCVLFFLFCSSELSGYPLFILFFVELRFYFADYLLHFSQLLYSSSENLLSTNYCDRGLGVGECTPVHYDTWVVARWQYSKFFVSGRLVMEESSGSLMSLGICGVVSSLVWMFRVMRVSTKTRFQLLTHEGAYSPSGFTTDFTCPCPVGH